MEEASSRRYSKRRELYEKLKGLQTSVTRNKNKKFAPFRCTHYNKYLRASINLAESTHHGLDKTQHLLMRMSTHYHFLKKDLQSSKKAENELQTRCAQLEQRVGFLEQTVLKKMDDIMAKQEQNSALQAEARHVLRQACKLHEYNIQHTLRNPPRRLSGKLLLPRNLKGNEKRAEDLWADFERKYAPRNARENADSNEGKSRGVAKK